MESSILKITDLGFRNISDLVNSVELTFICLLVCEIVVHTPT